MKTSVHSQHQILTVTGTPDRQRLMSELLRKQKSHVVLGANNSFQPQTDADWIHWTTIIESLLSAGIEVSMETEQKYQDKMQEQNFFDHGGFFLLTTTAK